MPIARFRKNIGRDRQNWYESIMLKPLYCIDWSKNAPKDVCEKLRTGNLNKNQTKSYLNKVIAPHYKDGYIFFMKNLAPFWYAREKEIIKRLERIHGKKMPEKQFNIYYTSFRRCPYKWKTGGIWWLQLNEYNQNKDFLCAIIIHELMHLFFTRYYWKFCSKQGLNQNQISNLKEALTVIINLEFSDILNAKDYGYDLHKKLRHYIAKEWPKHKNFKKLLITSCKYIKKNNLFTE